MVRTVFGLIVSLLLISFACSPVFHEKGKGRSGSGLGVVRSFVQGLGRQSDNRLIRFWTDTPFLEVKGLGVVAQGRKEIKDFLGYARTVDVKLSMSELTMIGDTIFCRLEETNRWLHLVGVEPMIYEARFVIAEGKIDGLIVEPEQGVWIMLTGPALSFGKWLKSEEPGALEVLMPGGRFRFTPENGRRLVELISRWRGIN
ncbi:hypothetical protein HPY86_02100 [candidate division WOR-3 bacterium]|nr:hypothetical protein [candidate division WOR-3 bacterium]